MSLGSPRRVGIQVMALIILTMALVGCEGTQPQQEYELEGSHSWDRSQISGTVFNRSSSPVPCVYVEYEVTDDRGKVVRTVSKKNNDGVGGNDAWSFTINVRSLSAQNVRRTALRPC